MPAAPAAAQAANTKKIEDIVKALADLGVAARDTQTRNLSLQKLDYGPNKGQYQASNILRVRLRDAPRAQERSSATTRSI